MILFSQIASVFAIALIGFISVKISKPKIQLKTLVMVSLLVGISVVLALLSWMIPLFGFPSLKIGFSQIPLMFIGFVFGPFWGFVGGLLADVLELLTGTIAFPFFGFTLNKVLVGFIPGLVVRIVKTDDRYTRMLPTIAIILISILAMSYVFSTNQIKVEGSLITVSLELKLVLSALIIFLLSGLLIGLNIILKQQKSHYAFLWILALILVEMIVQLMLTPLWLDVMYGIPFIVSVSVRLIKAVVMIVINSMIGLVLIKAILPIFRDKFTV
jgi:ECF transporter S component (folate family)